VLTIISDQKISDWNQRDVRKIVNLKISEIAVFLPHCLKKELIIKTKELLKRHNLTNVFIVNGQSQLLNIIALRPGLKAVIGIACLIEIESAKKHLPLPQIRIKLSCDGCKRTEFNFQELESWLSTIFRQIKE